MEHDSKLLINEVDEIDFLNDDKWDEKLRTKLESYPKLHDPVFQKYLDTLEEVEGEEDMYYELILLEMIVDGVVDLESVSDDGEVIFVKPIQS